VIGTLTAVASLALGVHAPASTPASTGSFARAGDAIAQVQGGEVVLADHRIRQAWSVDPAGQVTLTEVKDEATGAELAAPGAPEFSLTLDSAPTSSTLGWKLISASAQRIAPDPARPDAGRGVEIVFRYGLAARAGLVELDRTWSLYPGAAVEAVSSTLINRTPGVFRVGKYSLAQLTSPARVSAQVQAFHGGSDWRQDFRASTTEPGTFDDEGEIARFDAGTGAGWFLVGQRRGGSLSRVGRDSDGRTWVGVDNARDAFDWGPLMSSPPNYNRQDNPAYPAPVRQRTVLPRGRLDLGRAYLGVYDGGAQQAAAAFAQDFAAHEMAADTQTVDLNTFHPWEHGPGLSDANLRGQAAILKALGGEVLMLDDQWQGSSSGDWQWDTARFPISGSDGVPDFVKYLHSLGLQLGLWMSPAEFNMSSATYKAHPTWACTPTGDVTAQISDDAGLGVWDMTNRRLQAHLTGVIDRLIAQDGVREFKFDFVTWVDCPPHDYLDYEDAYASWVHEQQVRHPGVTFELDETNDQRLWALRSAALGPSWFDNGHLQGSSYPSRLLHDVWSAAPWIPPSSLGSGTYDDSVLKTYSVDYLMPIALLGHVTFWDDLTTISQADRAETAWWVSWYEAHRSDLGGLVYEDSSTDPVNGTSWAVLQPWHGDHGYVFAFRQAGAGDTDTVSLQGVDPGTSYTVTNVRTGAVLGTFTGAQLAQGLTVTLQARFSAVVLQVSPG
jgi:hypothetical protein